MNCSNKYKILIVEDDTNIRAFIATMLETGGYQALLADSCASGLLMFSSYNPDLTILDLGLPDRDGLELLSEVRKKSASPIIILSARSDELDKVYALDHGANDYVIKPFGSAELMARVRSALRNSLPRAEEGVLSGRFELGDLLIDYDARRFFMRGEEIKLTQTEYNIIALLSEHLGKVMTYTSIIKSVWGANDVGGTKKLQVNMANIRRKLGIKPGDNKYIVNELGVGYRMQSAD
jgi:two-component system KDP operon response regulator KdpE